MPRTIISYALHCTGRHQVGLAALSNAAFLLSAAPLELQRRFVNSIVWHGATAYAAVALSEQALKLVLNVYRGWVAESTVRSLRGTGEAAGRASPTDTGIEVAVILEEVKPIGGFTGISVSEPLLQCGILVSVIVYMFYPDAELRLIALAFRIEVGTVVAIVGGMGKLNDPWGDLVNWGRELSVVEVKYRLFAAALDRRARVARGQAPLQPG